MASTRRLSTMTDSSSGMLPPTRSPMGNPVSPSLSARDNYTTSTPHLNRHPHTTLSPRHPDISRYPLSDTPRSALPPTMSLSNSGGYGVASSMPYGQPDRQSDSPPFNAQDTYYEITCEGTPVTLNIEAKIDKGFFLSSDRTWTCYRRNYFAVSVFYGLTPWVPNGRLYLNHSQPGKQPEQIQSMAVSLAAAVDGSGGKSIELIQHTPKRDKGPQLPMKKEPLAPTPPGKSHEHGYNLNAFHTTTSSIAPQLPMQENADSNHSYSPTTHSNSNYQCSFERIQFKSATANNGKRRAQQQYYHLVAELWANVQSARETEPRWIKIAARSSAAVVVRGRSPSHYSNEGPHNPAGNARGSGGPGVGGSGHHGLGSNGGAGYRGGYSNGLSGSGGSGMSGHMYRGGTSYSVDPSPAGSHSISSASSLSGGPAEGLAGDQQMVDDEENKMMDGHEGYQYFPAPLYDSMHAKSEVHGLPMPERRIIKEEYPGSGAIASGWQVGNCGRFQGMETSRGYYPDVHAHAGF
ncbi:p53-like transcription factor [Polyplosphaeria fusca]|uniref:P53-like transcription factor n=1 Tax=Polyplosphaeria fusca TaxID=682080 RepID=A0A9P4UVH4_9PLEO|nr:p53-like transcription factor [Polyplosphaeria fusca]